jgi:hypothetical protein
LQAKDKWPGRFPGTCLACEGNTDMRSILLWVIGVPIPLILLLAMCTHHF